MASGERAYSDGERRLQHSQRHALGSGNGFESHRQRVSAAGLLVPVSRWVAALEVAALVYLLASIADAPRVAGAVTAAVHITRDGKLPKRERERVVVVLRVVLVALEVRPLRALSRDAVHRSTFVRIDLVGRKGGQSTSVATFTAAAATAAASSASALAANIGASSAQPRHRPLSEAHFTLQLLHFTSLKRCR